jgi:hypothetical protein
MLLHGFPQFRITITNMNQIIRGRSIYGKMLHSKFRGEGGEEHGIPLTKTGEDTFARNPFVPKDAFHINA